MYGYFLNYEKVTGKKGAPEDSERALKGFREKDYFSAKYL